MEITSAELRLDYRIIGVKHRYQQFQFFYGKCSITEIVKVVTDIIAGLTELDRTFSSSYTKYWPPSKLW